MAVHERELFDPPQNVADPEAWAWAQRVIREVTEEAASQDRQARDFLHTWVRWREMVGFLNFADLGLMRRGRMGANERQSHETLNAALISIGGVMRDWAKNFDSQTLDLAGYSQPELETLLESLRESADMWHSKRSAPRIQAIQALIVDD